MVNWIIAVAIAIIGFTINGTAIVIAQGSQLNNDNINRSSTTTLNSTNIKLDTDKEHIVVKWLEPNGTVSDSNPVISVNIQDFWEIFGPLLKLSSNGTLSTFEYLPP
jgi:hypothetical protein